MNLELVLEYTLRILPALLLAIVLLILVPKKLLWIRSGIYIGFFAVIRDAMTPAGFWHFETLSHAWVRFDSLETLVILGGACLLMTGLSLSWEQHLRKTVVWFRTGKVAATLGGLSGAGLIATLVYVYNYNVPIESRGGYVSQSDLPLILTFSLAGNLFEELIFRGYLQGTLLKDLSAVRSILISGIAFAFAHLYLAVVLNNISLPTLIFTCVEGLVCGAVAYRFGLYASTLTHGLAIFALTSGLV